MITPCQDYSPAAMESALSRILAEIPGWCEVPPGGQVFLKPNLLMPRHPDECVTTHPQLVAAAGSAFCSRGFRVLIGDSPGGPLTRPLLERLYARTGMGTAAAQCGGELCYDTAAAVIEPTVSTAGRRLTIWEPVLQADALVNLCKLKTHGLTGLTGAVKNLFGCVPGMLKTEYHMNQPTVTTFSDALVDLAHFLAPRLSVMDAVFAMEGPGPSHGRPRHVGLLLGSPDPFSLDYAVARMLGVGPEGFTTLAAALRKGYGPQDDGDLTVVVSSGTGAQTAGGGEAVELLRRLGPPSFDLLEPENLASLHGRGWVRHAIKAVQPLLRARPVVDETGCSRCATCVRHCPAKAVTMGPAGPRFELERCIRCFCCQELCPRGAIRIHRPWGSRLIYGRPTRKT